MVMLGREVAASSAFLMVAVVTAAASAQRVPEHAPFVPRRIAELTAYRPQHGAGYAPFARTAVDELDEDSATDGPGVRINEPGDVDPQGEDDLVEVRLSVGEPGAQLALRRGDAALRVWTTRDRQAGTEILFFEDKSDVLPLGPGQNHLTLWVEWAAASHGTAELHVESPAGQVPMDTLVFHTFRSIVVALGGENQVPSDPADPNQGTFVAATDLYRQGYDVHMYDEDDVEADGSGPVFDEIANAVQNRGVDEVAIYGYSHGGGSTYDLADLLDISRAGLGVFEIRFTSYVDSVSNNSDLDVAQELRRPPSSGYHLNHYQHGSFFEDLGLDGGPVDDSNPPPTGLDVETTPWGASATHFEVDDFVQVLDLLEATLAGNVSRSQRIVSATTLGVGRLARADGVSPSVRLGVPLILLSLFNNASASPLDDDQSIVTPDPDVQELIATVSNGGTEMERREALNGLRELADADDEWVVRQLVYSLSRARDTRDAMVAGAVIQRLAIPADAVVRALVPLLEANDADLRRAAGNILAGFESRAAGRRPDFSRYREIIAAGLRRGHDPPDGLVRHMYAFDPGEALLTMMRAHQLRDPAELRELLWAEHAVADMLWKQRNGFLGRDEVEPVAAEELDKLATREPWWVRLYVAEIMSRHIGFRRPDLMRALQADPHHLVRDAASSTPR